MKHWKKIYGQTVNFVCPYCLEIKPMKQATLEHEPPKSRQKELGKSKTYLACKKCNNEKGALTADEYKLWKRPADYLTWVRLERIRNGNIRGI